MTTHSYFPNDQDAADAAQAEAEDEFPIHSGEGPHHHHRHEWHRHERHKHRHIDNSIDSHDTINMGDPNQVGTVAHAVAHIQACLKALPGRRERHLAIGHAMSRLIESEHLSGTADVIKEVIASTNRYSHVGDA